MMRLWLRWVGANSLDKLVNGQLGVKLCRVDWLSLNLEGLIENHVGAGQTNYATGQFIDDVLMAK